MTLRTAASLQRFFYFFKFDTEEKKMYNIKNEMIFLVSMWSSS